jgi:hypothetical protein
MPNIEDSFAKLKFEFDQKTSEIRALETQRRAAEQRLADNIRRESESQVALKRVSEQLAQASKDLSQAKRNAAKVLSDASTDADRIRAKARDEAQGFLDGIRSAVQAAASLIKSKEK